MSGNKNYNRGGGRGRGGGGRSGTQMRYQQGVEDGQQQGVVNQPPAQQNRPVQRWPQRQQHFGGLSSVEAATSSDMRLLQISASPSPALATSPGNKLLPMKRPDRRGRDAVRSSQLLVNHFPVSFNPQSIIKHYEVDVKLDVAPGSRLVSKTVPKSDLRSIRDKLFSDTADILPMDKTAYDGEKSIFSAVDLPSASYKVELSDGEDTRSRTYSIHLPNGDHVVISRKGQVSLAPTLILDDVLCVPSFKHNLLSVQRLIKYNNGDVQFFLTHCLIADRDTKHIHAVGIAKNGLYYVDMNTPNSTVAVNSSAVSGGHAGDAILPFNNVIKFFGIISRSLFYRFIR